MTVFASFSRPRSSIACSWLGGRPAARRSGSSTCIACSIAGSNWRRKKVRLSGMSKAPWRSMHHGTAAAMAQQQGVATRLTACMAAASNARGLRHFLVVRTWLTAGTWRSVLKSLSKPKTTIRRSACRECSMRWGSSRCHIMLRHWGCLRPSSSTTHADHAISHPVCP